MAIRLCMDSAILSSSSARPMLGMSVHVAVRHPTTRMATKRLFRDICGAPKVRICWCRQRPRVPLWADRGFLRRGMDCLARGLVRGNRSGSAFVELEAPVDHVAEPDAAQEA